MATPAQDVEQSSDQIAPSAANFAVRTSRWPPGPVATTGAALPEPEPPESEPPRNADPRGSLLTVRASYELAIPLAFVGLPRVVVSASSARRIEWTP